MLLKSALSSFKNTGRNTYPPLAGSMRGRLTHIVPGVIDPAQLNPGTRATVEYFIVSGTVTRLAQEKQGCQSLFTGVLLLHPAMVEYTHRQPPRTKANNGLLDYHYPTLP
jgi:hypothetical protein